MNKRFLILIAGPTAVGKTAMAIHVARAFQTEIISADSRQCYRELNIGVARPSPEELSAVKHHFIATHSVLDEVNAATFEKYALSVSENLFRDHETVVLTGGTGLYIRAFLQGLDDIPSVPATIRENLILKYNEYGREWLRAQIISKDSLYALNGDLNNPHRMLRALEIWEYFGKSILSYRQNMKSSRPFEVISIGLDMQRESLYDRINARVVKMIEAGLVNEVKQLEQFANLTPLQTVGYKELFSFFRNEYSMEKGISLIQQNTRHYAKRQLTWFRNQENLDRFHPNDVEGVLKHIKHKRANGAL